MMAEKELAESQLVADIKTIIHDTQQEMKRAGNRIMIQAYWRVGQRVVQEGLAESSYRSLAAELDIEYTQFFRCVQFYQQWPQACPESDRIDPDNILTWSHYRLLIAEKDGKRRAELMRQARREKWTRRQLQERLRSKDKDSSSAPASVTDSPTSTVSYEPLSPSISMLFIYAAKVINVIDGDTLELMIDLGFEVWKEHRIRLRGINAPESKTPEGARATAYVEERLAECPRIIVKTSRRVDMYGRYIGDIFYLPGETDRDMILQQGIYLNNELVERRLAGRY